MRSWTRAIAALAAGLMAAMSMLVVLAPSAGATPSEESDFVGRINALRASVGAGPLSVDGHLTDVARTWSTQMAAAGAISHNPNLANLFTGWRVLGENVGVGPSVDWLESAFVASPHHYSNLVDPDYTLIGVGIVDSGGQIWVTEDFEDPKVGGVAVPAAAPAPKPAPAPRPVATTPRPVVVHTAPKAAATAPPVTTPPTTAPPVTTPPTTVPTPPATVLATQDRPSAPVSTGHSTSPFVLGGEVALVLLIGTAALVWVRRTPAFS